MRIEALPAAVVSEVRSVSVVVPVWQESVERLAALRAIGEWPEVREVIVAAAEETETVRVAVTRTGAVCLGAGRPNRGRQLNLGARHATGEWLLFNHADTRLTRAHVQALAALTSRAEIIGGAFYRHFDERHPRSRWLEPLERWHNRSFGALYGDQSIFVRRAHFADRLGGFADIPLMEDVEFSQRLRRSGHVVLLDPPITSSPRRHLQCGRWKTTLTNATLIALFRLGIRPERLHAWYYGTSQPAGAPASILSQTHES